AETPLIFTRPEGREWPNGDVLVAPGTDYEGKIVFEDGAESTVIAVVGESTTTYTGRNFAIEGPDARTIVMGARFSVRYLYDAAKIDFYGLENVTVTFAVNDGEAETATLTKGEGDLERYYCFFITGIPAKDYNTVAITVTTAVTGKEPVVFDDSIAKALEDLAATTEGEVNEQDNENLSRAITQYAAALAGYFYETEIPAVTSTVDDTWIAGKIAGATTHTVTLSEGVKAAGVNIAATDGVTINFWVKAAEGTEITAAALGEATLENGKLVLTDRGNGYWSISYACGVEDLSDLLALTVNGGTTEFKACPLSFAKDLSASAGNEDLGRAVIEYAYYVSTLCK
ncbi:MAG: hypothetical protein II776_01780, partial [Clostridia bacterium]|nr:hypothetical protein [Clostridia bacterium]